MTLLTKEISQLTDTERQEMFTPLGTQDIPYPSSRFVTDQNGQTGMELGLIAEKTPRMGLWSDRADAYGIGQMFRRMTIPSLLHMQKEALLRRAPDSKKRVTLILGMPGTGKSDIAKTLADVSDARGADIIDCGGRHLGDLLWEQVIDYGQDFKTALTARIREGQLSAESAAAIDRKFPKALSRNAKGTVNGIDWGQTVDNSADANAALAASVAFARTISEYEGIPAQTVSVVGIKKVPGVFKRWHDEGRTGILDEYTKSIMGSDDSLQTMLQYLNGEIDEVTVTNTMKVDGRDETTAYTLRRSEMKAGFNVYLTGNDQDDGVSTHMLSKSAYSRLPMFKIDTVEPIDWSHRISQFWTGLPLTTLVTCFSGLASDDPEEFGQSMIDLRLLGLDEKKQAETPAHQLTLLHNWENTSKAVEKMANFYVFWTKIIDPRSDLYDERPQNKIYQDILPEISPSYRDECSMDFRKIYQDFDEALQIKPVVSDLVGTSALRFNFSAASRKKQAPPVENPEAITAGLGTRLETVILERICTMTKGRPNLQAALVKEAQERGILTVDASKKKETLASLLNQDAYTKIGGLQNVEALREALVTRLKKINPWMRGKTDDEIMPVDRAAEASLQLAQMTQELTGAGNARTAPLVILGPDATNVFNKASAVDTIGSGEKPAVANLIPVPDFLESLKIPAIANMNMGNIWRRTISSEKMIPLSDETKPIIQLAEGAHASQLGITTLMFKAANDNTPVPMYVVSDRARNKHLIVMEKSASAAKSDPGEDFTVVALDDTLARKKIDAFIKSATAEKESDANALEAQLTYAFMLRAGGDGDLKPLSQMLTRKNMTADAAVYMVNKPV